MNILFWNLHENSITDYIVECLNRYKIDVAIFSEYSGVDFEEIAIRTSLKHVENIGGCNKVTMVASDNVSVNHQFEQSRYIIYSICYHDKDYLITGIHLQDKRNYPDNGERLHTIRDITSNLSEIEDKNRCNRSIVIGDFNSNPFDSELTQIDAFNSVLFKDLMEESDIKTYEGVDYKRFYNPMLTCLSERRKNYGSYYYSNGINCLYWNCLDQVLVRKSLMNSIEQVRFLRRIGRRPLVSKVKPSSRISDHLPLLVKLAIGGNKDE